MIDTLSHAINALDIKTIILKEDSTPSIKFEVQQLYNSNTVALSNITMNGNYSDLLWDFGDGSTYSGTNPRNILIIRREHTLLQQAAIMGTKIYVLPNLNRFVCSPQIPCFQQTSYWYILTLRKTTCLYILKIWWKMERS